MAEVNVGGHVEDEMYFRTNVQEFRMNQRNHDAQNPVWTGR